MHQKPLGEVVLLEGLGASATTYLRKGSAWGKNAENAFSDLPETSFSQSLGLRAVSPGLGVHVSAGQRRGMAWRESCRSAVTLSATLPRGHRHTAARRGREVSDCLPGTLCCGSSWRGHQGEKGLPLNHITVHLSLLGCKRSLGTLDHSLAFHHFLAPSPGVSNHLWQRANVRAVS